MSDMQDMIRRNGFTIEYPHGHKTLKGEEDISFINKMKFDIRNKYLIGYGDHKILIYNTNPKAKEEEHRILTIDSTIYGKIRALQFSSAE
jgi:hypothetical protein